MNRVYMLHWVFLNNFKKKMRYLVLDSGGVGVGARDEKLPRSMNMRERGNFNLTKYVFRRKL